MLLSPARTSRRRPLGVYSPAIRLSGQPADSLGQEQDNGGLRSGTDDPIDRPSLALVVVCGRRKH